MNKLSSKIFLIYSVAVVILVSVFRFFQYVSIIDYSTGFFLREASLGGNLLYVLLAVFGAGFIALTFLGKKKAWSALTVSSDGMSNRATLFLGASFIIVAASKLLITMNMVDGGAFKLISSYVFSACMGALGLVLLKNTVPPIISGFIALFPAIYYFTLASEIFSEDLIIKNRSDNLILLLCYVCGTMFFASSARFFSRLETKLSRSRELIFGGFTFMLSFIHVLSKLLAYAFGGDAVFGMPPVSADAVLLLIISGTFLFVVCLTENNKEIDYLVVEKKKEKESSQPESSNENEE